eukprot:1248249-Pyramimonas_sp.AAC.1
MRARPTHEQRHGVPDVGEQIRVVPNGVVRRPATLPSADPSIASTVYAEMHKPFRTHTAAQDCTPQHPRTRSDVLGHMVHNVKGRRSVPFSQHSFAWAVPPTEDASEVQVPG